MRRVVIFLFVASRRPLSSRSSLSRRSLAKAEIVSTPSRRPRRSSRRTVRIDIGVRTIQVTDKNRPDILNIKEGGPIVRYDRTLTLEVWYPATLAAGQKPGGEYRVITRDPAVMATLYGKAVRDAQAKSGSRYPLVIISHGYPGNRFLMSHMGENLASKGFVTVSIDHKDSTYDDQKAFGSTLYNRPFDQLFVLNEIDRLGKPGSGSFLAGLVDASRAGARRKMSRASAWSTRIPVAWTMSRAAR